MDWRQFVGLPDKFADWQVEPHADGAAWIAVRREGTAVRVIAGHDIPGLRAKLERASAEDSG